MGMLRREKYFGSKARLLHYISASSFSSFHVPPSTIEDTFGVLG